LRRRRCWQVAVADIDTSGYLSMKLAMFEQSWIIDRPEYRRLS